MNGINKKHSKFIALLMAFIMVFTMIPTMAFAAEETTIYTGSDWPYSSYYVQTLSLSGAEVSYINGTDVYLDSCTEGDAEITLTVTAGGRSSGNLGINWNDDPTNTKTFTTNLVNGEATVKVYAYKASGAGVSRSGTKTFNIRIAAPNESPMLADGYSAEAEASVTSGESFDLNLGSVFSDADGDTLSYTVSIDGGSAIAADAAYSYLNTIPGTYTLKFTATDGKTMGDKQPTHTVVLTVKNSEVKYDVIVTLPEGLSAKFYAVNTVNSGTVVKGDELSFENGVVKVPENISRIMWEAEGTVGFSAPVSAESQIQLVKVSFDTKLDSGVTDENATMTVTDSKGVKVAGAAADTYLLPSMEGFAYKAATSNSAYNGAELKDQTPVNGKVEITFILKHFTVIAPAGSVVSAGTLSGSFSYSFSTAISSETVGETVVYKFAPLKGNAFVRVQRPDDNDAVTYWDWRSSKADGNTVTITKDMLFMNDSADDKFDADTVYRNFEKYMLDLGDIYMNINNQGYVNLEVGGTMGLNMFRNWQAIESFSNSKISLPDFEYDIINIDGEDVISIEPNKNNTAAATLTAKNEGTAIVLVTYDAMYSDSTAGNAGGGAGGGNRLSAIWPDRTGVFVVSVGKDGTTIKSNMTCNGAVFDAEHSPQFYTGNAGASVSFKPDEGVTVTVNRSTVGKETLSFGKFTDNGVTVAEDGTVTVNGLTTGRHIIRLEKDGIASYQVVTAQQVTAKYYDKDGNDIGDNPVFTPGESITIKIKGLTNPAEKFATKYNFNAQVVYTDGEGNTYKNSSGTGNGRYDFSSTEQVITVNVPADYQGDKIVLNGAIQMGGFAGDGIGSHRKVNYGVGSGMATGTGAGMVLGTLPELLITSVTHEHSFVNEVVSSKYFASLADFSNGTAYYKSCVCGKAGTETFIADESLGSPIKSDAKAEVENYKNPADYRDAQKAELVAAIEAAIEAIDKAVDKAAVEEAVAEAKAAMDAIKTDAQLTVEEEAAAAAALAQAKAEAKAEVENYKNPADYRDAQKAELVAAIEEAIEVIDAAADKEAVEEAVADAKAAMDAIKTDAQLKAEEAAASIATKVEKLPTVDATKPVQKVEVGTTEAAKDILDDTAKNIVEAIKKDTEKVDIVDKAVVDAVKDSVTAGKNVIVSTNVEVKLVDTKDIEKTFGKEDVAKVEKAAGKATIAQYLDLNVLMTVYADGKEVTKGNVNKLDKAITFTIAIPENLEKVDEGITRNYFVIRVHDGEVTKLPTKINSDGTLSFETDCFSTYALVYEDVAKTGATNTESPKTGDANSMMSWMAAMMVAAIGVTVIRRKEN